LGPIILEENGTLDRVIKDIVFYTWKRREMSVDKNFMLIHLTPSCY